MVPIVTCSTWPFLVDNGPIPCHLLPSSATIQSYEYDPRSIKAASNLHPDRSGPDICGVRRGLRGWLKSIRVSRRWGLIDRDKRARYIRPTIHQQAWLYDATYVNLGTYWAVNVPENPSLWAKLGVECQSVVGGIERGWDVKPSPHLTA